MSRVVFLANQLGGGTTVLGAGTEIDMHATSDEAALRVWQSEGKVAFVGAAIRGIHIPARAATTATIAWTVDQPCTGMQVEYGLTSSYGSIQAATPAAGIGAITAALTGLTTATLYHYRIKVVVGTAITYSPDATFTTA